MERTVIATLFRKNKPVWTRRYLSVGNAIRRATEIAVTEGHPKDVVEFYHAQSGLDIGTVKLHVEGRLTANWTVFKRAYEITQSV